MSASVSLFESAFGAKPTVLSHAPGRLEILGNHTDYNDGVVLSCASGQATWIAAAPLEGAGCELVSLYGDEEWRCDFSLDQLDGAVPGHWANYIKGVIQAVQRRGHTCQGFRAAITSEVPLSAGMSSSAALEIAAALAIGKLSQIELPADEWARIGQEAENRFVGANTGLLDQFSSLFGKAGHLVYIDFRSFAVSPQTFDADVAWVVTNTNVKHDLTTDYNDRRESCEAAAAAVAAGYPEVKALRDVTQQMLDACKEQMAIIDYRRACHIIGENDRVHAGLEAMAAGDAAAFGKLLTASHTSSRENFENSCPELDILVAQGCALPGCYGGRLSGGGFGGITIHLVAATETEDFCERLAVAYKTRTEQTVTPLVCSIGDGASVRSLV